MAMVSKVSPPVGRARRITGLILIVLGAAISARVCEIGLGAFDGRFGHDEWVRFAALLWLGAMLALTGCWMAYRSRLAAWAAAAAVLALVVAADRWSR